MVAVGGLFYSSFNFVLLVIFFYLTLKPMSREFFYTRREGIKKNLAASAWKLRKARLNFSEIKNKHEGLMDDIKSRQDGIEESSKRECATIIEEAQRRKEYILSTAKQVSEMEFRDSARLFREKLISEAFARVRSTIEADMSEPARKKMVERGLGALSEEMSLGKISVEALGRIGVGGNPS